ncbi:NADH-quinone oxidoreductase subunit L [Candidatus Bathyarchaeota archaeon]|nr:NADH-quinone oxidoreductase subunit L [Candidatus Bathyarchaeota archaeon]
MGIEALLNHPGPWLSWILPITGALLMPLLTRLGHRIRDYAAVAFAFSSVICAASMLPYLFTGKYPGELTLTTWIDFPGHPLKVGLLVDPLSIIISNVVAFIAFLIVVYSVGYMHGDPHMARYWFFFLFFIGNMLLLVLSNNLLQLLIGWEGVGLCSYGLIGYYYRDEKERWLGGPPPTKMYPPSHAGMKAFVVTGIGDVFLLAAIFIIFHYAGTLNFEELIELAPEWLPAISATPGLLSITAICFLGGPIGKSAQFPLHEWLPEAMAGPTSVSALIHAATMVKAGVYLVARMSPVFYLGGWAYHLDEALVYFTAIALVGAFTTFLAASQAIVALELKKVLAYSTISQIGYMMLGLGVSGLSKDGYLAGLTSGVFHLMSHALFKAALFLCAGSVIHAVESIYMSDMGGLKRYMPITHSLMLIATLSLAGIPPLSGFWSKDSVFLACLTAGTPLSLALLAVASISAAMTFFYSIRYMSMTFYGHESEFLRNLIKGIHHNGGETQGHQGSSNEHSYGHREDEKSGSEHLNAGEHHAPPHEEHGAKHIHEAPMVMWIPYAILVVMVIAVGLLGLVGLFNPKLSPEVFIEHQLEEMLHHLGVEIHPAEVGASTKLMAAMISAVMLLVGGVTGWIFYLARKIDPWALVSASPLLRGLHTFLWNRWYMNPTYYAIFVDGLLSFKDWLNRGLEKAVFDRISPAMAGLFKALGGVMFKGLEMGVMERGLNRGVPNAVTVLYHKVKRLQTGILNYNILYIGITFFLLTLIILLRLGGL